MTQIKIFLLAVMVVLFCGPATTRAAEKKTNLKAKTFTLATYPNSVGERLIASASKPKLLRREFDKAIPQFKVPAQAVIKCLMGIDGIECGELAYDKQCPGQIEVQIPGQNRPVSLDIECVGPDANGECECEVAGN